ncbi:MAG: histidine phosphatase family protein [Ruminococcaceae bacterium]|nr:histidine phosphatase family protein [Oscillospiraceae bacterium]
MTTIYLIRHGESEANLARIFTGSGDFPLTELGRSQAALAAEYLRDKHISAVYASPLCRAFETGMATANALSVPIIKNDGLKEIFAGIWEGRKFDDLEKEFPDTYYVWRNDIGKAAPDGGEKVTELYDRVVKTVTEIAKENDGKSIAIASHATPIRTFSAFCLGIKKENVKELPWPANASITRVTYDNGKFFNLEYNICEHLGDTITHLPKNV